MGTYSTQTRNLPSPALYSSSIITPTGTISHSYLPGSGFDAQAQTTYSYRTSGTNPEIVSKDDLAVTRNGFTTFDPTYDNGHEFWTEKKTAVSLSPECFFTWRDSANKSIAFRGHLCPSLRPNVPIESLWPSVTRLTAKDSLVASYGGRAIAATQPLKSHANLSQFLGELIQELPSMIGAAFLQDKALSFRSYGGEYLNVQFGWAPFISDLRAICVSLLHASQALTQIDRDNGRNVRRGFAFPTEVTTGTQRSTNNVSAYNPFAGLPGDSTIFPSSGRPASYYIDTTTTRWWFKGCYSYFIPVGDSVVSKLRRYEALANVLLGSRVTPATLWELAPWSWLIDWKLTIGKSLSNAQAFADDSLVMRYGYLMRHTKALRTYYVDPAATNTGSYVPGTKLLYLREVKERVRATPYGFGISPTSLSQAQWAILVALGLARTPGKLL